MYRIIYAFKFKNGKLKKTRYIVDVDQKELEYIKKNKCKEACILSVTKLDEE